VRAALCVKAEARMKRTNHSSPANAQIEMSQRNSRSAVANLENRACRKSMQRQWWQTGAQGLQNKSCPAACLPEENLRQTKKLCSAAFGM
jgi:hypothetical protein